jgi:hypothetical protein
LIGRDGSPRPPLARVLQTELFSERHHLKRLREPVDELVEDQHGNLKRSFKPWPRVLGKHVVEGEYQRVGAQRGR